MAQREVGLMYFQGGPGFERDYIAAYQWLRLYSLQSLQVEPEELVRLRRSMKEEELRAAEKWVEAWRPK